MRPGRVEDLPAMVRLWEREVLAGRRDSAPHGRFMQRILSGFDWEAGSRVEEGANGMRGMVLVMRRQAEDATGGRVGAAGTPDGDQPLPPVVPVDGYHLLDPATIPPSAWVDTFNGSFADHWRHTNRTADELRLGRRPDLDLMLADRAGRPAAITLCEIEEYAVDLRPQPVGLVGSVGTLPAHPRLGLAPVLVTESLARL